VEWCAEDPTYGRRGEKKNLAAEANTSDEATAEPLV
jgi:hypothetical protein